MDTTQTLTAAPDGAGVLDEDRVWVTAAMPRELAESASLAAGSNGTNRSAVIRGALRQYIDDAQKSGAES